MTYGQLARIFAAFVISLAIEHPLTGCERCNGQQQYPNGLPCDNRGLLDVLDSAAKRLQPTLPKLEMPRLRSIDLGLSLRGGRGIWGATCGCELAVLDGQHPNSQFYGRDGSSFYHSSPYPPPATREYGEPKRLPSNMHVEPTQAAPHLPPPLDNRHPNFVPLPDSHVDPFQDESASRVRRIPVRTIDYRQPDSRYRESYDPQADGRARAGLSDGTRPPPQSVALASEASSRTRRYSNGAHASLTDALVPNVITASAGELPRLPSRDELSGTVPSNPLRDH